MSRKPITKSKNILNKKDDAVASVVGEMLLIAIGLILVGVVSVSIMNLLPGDTETITDITMDDRNASWGNVTFYHKGGQVISKDDMKIILYVNNTQHVIPATKQWEIFVDNKTWFTMSSSTVTGTTNTTKSFDVGTCVYLDIGYSNMASGTLNTSLTLPSWLLGADVRITANNAIVYSGRIHT